MKILIDNGHGQDTLGKRSPDGILQEWQYTREIAQRVVTSLRLKGYSAEILVHEIIDVPLAERVRRVKRWCDKVGSTQVIVVSIHLNASGNGEWKNASGWEAYTSIGDTDADKLATCLYNAAERICSSRNPEVKIRTDWSDKDPDKEAKFYILTKTSCPAVLTENFFMDCPQDYAYLLSEGGKKDVVDLHVDGIIEYIKKQKR